MTCGQRMRALRDKGGLTRAEAARRVGIAVSTLRNWENDWGFPRLPALVRLAEVLRVPVERFAEGAEDPAGDEPELAQRRSQQRREYAFTVSPTFTASAITCSPRGAEGPS
jgi:transcriptional regulator with XRE-family HTH domain